MTEDGRFLFLAAAAPAVAKTRATLRKRIPLSSFSSSLGAAGE